MMSLVLVTTFSAQAQKETFQVCNGKIEVVVNDLAPNSQSSALVTNYQITVAPDAVGNCSSLVITPAVIANDSKDKKLVEVIVVNGPGKKGSDRWLENSIYKVCDPNNVRFYTLKENESLVIKTNSQLPYEAWMDNGKFVITTQEATYNPNCIKRLCGTEDVCDIPYLKSPLTIAPLWVNMPAVAGDGARDPKRAVKTRLYFPVNGIKSVESYLENADALSLLSTLDSPNFDVDKIKIEGWASPEASVAYNKNLSNNRAKTMKKIIADKYNFPENIYDVKGNGEYWVDVLNYIATSDDPAILASKDKLDKFVADNEDTNLDKKEILLKRIDNGKPYKAIFDKVYPRSRFTDCEVSYKVKGYDREEAMVIFKNDPKQLSADEYVQLLNDGADAAVLAKAVEIYPNDSRINSIAAERAKNAGNIDAALSYYQKAGNSPEAYNNQGCCWLLKGNAEKAQECFNKAKGLDVAEGNANEVRKVVLNNKFFK
ncbi:MAG: hypothetical protein PHG78_00325 [Bacteroidales bacterium]|nr:hypothetical protein [Bacteroidales bacterium]